MTSITIIALLVLLLGCALAIGLLWHWRTDCQRLKREREEAVNQEQAAQTQLHELQTKLELSQQEVQQKQSDNQRLEAERDEAARQGQLAQTQAHELQTKLELSQQEVLQKEEAFTQAQKQSQDKFEALASQTLKNANEQFLQLAKKTFEGDKKDATAALEERKVAIETLIKPIREQLEKHKTQADLMEKNREGAYRGLHQQVTSLVEAQQCLSQHTTALTSALKGSASTRGQWGELTLKRIVDLAGMNEYCDYDQQVSVMGNDQAQQRPDMVVHMPSDRTIVIDSKAVGKNYFEAVEAQDPDQREALFKKHANDLVTQVKELSKKQYTQQFKNTPDFVVMFVPADSFLQPAMQYNPGLLEKALENNVVIATPSTLIALLKVVAMGWREQQMAQNAQEICTLGRELCERLVIMTNHIAGMGKGLENSLKSYNKLVKSFDSRVMVSVRRFEGLGVKLDKQLPPPVAEIEQVLQEIKTVPSEAVDSETA